MPVQTGKKRVTLSGHCSVEEAESLFDWLQKHEKGDADLGSLEHPHAAVLQILMAGQTRISSMPADEFCAACIVQAMLLSDMEKNK